MKQYFNPRLLPLLPLGAGVAGFVLRAILYAGTDEKGLLPADHPIGHILFILSALVLAVLVLTVQSIDAPKAYAQRFPESPVAALGCMAAAAGILLTDTYELLLKQDFITVACFVLGILAAVCLVFAGNCRLNGRHPSFLLHCVVTVYLMLHPLSQYRLWSADPQLMNHCFHLLASVFLMLTAYQRTALDAHRGSIKWYTFCSQAALFFCCLSIHGDSWLFYLTTAIWTATNLCVLAKEEATEEEA